MAQNPIATIVINGGKEIKVELPEKIAELTDGVKNYLTEI